MAEVNADIKTEALKIQNIALKAWNRFCNKCRSDCLTLFTKGKLTEDNLMKVINKCKHCSKEYELIVSENSK